MCIPKPVTSVIRNCSRVPTNVISYTLLILFNQTFDLLINKIKTIRKVKCIADSKKIPKLTQNVLGEKYGIEQETVLDILGISRNFITSSMPIILQEILVCSQSDTNDCSNLLSCLYIYIYDWTYQRGVLYTH